MDFEALKKQRNENNPFAEMLGITLTELSEGYARAEMTVLDGHTNPVGSCHGGCLYTIADVASGAAAASFGHYAVTVSSSFNYLSKADPGMRIAAEARTEKAGRSIIAIRVEVLDCGSGKLLCTSGFTYYRLEKAIVL